MIYFALAVLLALSFSETECRRPGRNRILSGTDAPLSRFDYYVFLYNGRERCGGSLIRIQDRVQESDVILTAAHCLIAEDGSVVDASNMTIYNGNLDKLNSKVRRVIPHPQYNQSRNNKHDIALLVLDKPIPRNKIGTIRVAETKKSDFDDCEVAGWGSTVERNVGEPDALQYGKTSIHHNESDNCDWTKNTPFDTNTMLCTDILVGKAITCSGVSGGPLTCKSNTDGQSYLVGVTSFGADVCKEQPPIFTWTTAYLQWIKDQAAFWGATA